MSATVVNDIAVNVIVIVWREDVDWEATIWLWHVVIVVPSFRWIGWGIIMGAIPLVVAPTNPRREEAI